MVLRLSGQRSKPLIRDPALQAHEATADAEPSSDDQRRPGGLEALIARADANAAALDRWVSQSQWIEHLAGDPAIRSNTSVCLQFADRSDQEANKARQKAIVKLLESEGAAYDLGAYRDAPPGLRIWCGATVETSDIEAVTPWLDWAWEQAK